MIISAIKRGVPVPRRSGGKFGDITRAVLEMKPGDYRDFTEGNGRAIQCAVLDAGKRAGFVVTTRKINGEGVAVWRLK